MAANGLFGLLPTRKLPATLSDMKTSPIVVKLASAAAVIGGSFLFAAPAHADYGPSTPAQVGDLNGSSAVPAATPAAATPILTGSTPTPVESNSGSLPFTGGDVAGLAALGGGLVAFGFGAHRLSNRGLKA